MQTNLTRTIVVSDLDSYVMERASKQPPIETLEASEAPVDLSSIHRLSLPEYFEKMSADCTRGQSCHVHQVNGIGVVQNPGPYVFRWVVKKKQALDYAFNIRQWLVVNRAQTPFANLPSHLLSANGCVEEGDSILLFMPWTRAKVLREAPGKLSQERLRARLTSVGKNRVLMTSDLENENFYEPQWGSEQAEDQTPSATTEP